VWGLGGRLRLRLRKATARSLVIRTTRRATGTRPRKPPRRRARTC
jgi:hypothetical protein